MVTGRCRYGFRFSIKTRALCCLSTTDGRRSKNDLQGVVPSRRKEGYTAARRLKMQHPSKTTPKVMFDETDQVAKACVNEPYCALLVQGPAVVACCSYVCGCYVPVEGTQPCGRWKNRRSPQDLLPLTRLPFERGGEENLKKGTRGAVTSETTKKRLQV